MKITSRIFCTTIASSATDNCIDAVWSFNHFVDWFASWKRFLLLNHIGDSGRANITKLKENAIALQNQAKVSHLTILPMVYALKIPTDIIIDGSEPRMPRIAGSQLSPIYKII